MILEKTKATTVAAAVLVGGIVSGGLLAMATPTSMSHQSETWRDMIGVRRVAFDDGSIPIYAPPEDLSPVSWQTAAQEYPAMALKNEQDDRWVDVSNDVVADVIPDLDDPYQPEAAAEALPAEIMRSRTTAPDLAVAGDDAAASTANAAQAAAADVRSQENAAAEPAAAPASTADATTPQAFTGTS